MANREKPDDLERRRRDLEAALAARRPEEPSDGGSAKTGGAGGYANALRLSSEFIAGIVVGAGLGWFIDRTAGTAPWGMIIFLLLGFGAGVLNVLRSAGLMAEFGSKAPNKGDAGPGEKK
ncbi:MULTISPECIES: AtpZ/AtpI family protein [Chelativorans]|nr:MULTISPECIES: AtpZ/AtpI family protein [Chelativorans]